MTDRATELSHRITEYLHVGGLFNPELADHYAVRDLLIEIRDYLRLTIVKPVELEWTENYGQGSEPWLKDDEK